MADNNNAFTAVDPAGYDYYGDGTDYSDCWTYPKEKIDELVGDSLTGIETAKEEAIAAVQEAGSDAVQEIEAKGEETLESIPDDYTQLSEDVSELKADLTHLENDKADIIINSASGAIASFADGADGMPMKSVVCEINPVQDLHGYEYPYPGGGGKNKFDISSQPSGAGVINNGDGSITVNTSSTSTGVTWLNRTLSQLVPSLVAGETYYLNATTTGSHEYIYCSVRWDFGTAKEVTQAMLDAVVYFYASGVSTSATIKDIIFCKNTETDKSFAPYENICPISGHIEVDAVRAGKNLFDKSKITEGFFVRAANTTAEKPLGNLDSNASWNCSDYIRVKSNTRYTLSLPFYSSAGAAGLVFFSDKSIESAILGVPTATQSAAIYSFTTPVNCNYLRFSWNKQNGNNCQLELGSSASTYEAFNGQFVTYTLGQTVYAGTLTINEDGSGTIVSTEGKAVYDGSSDESWEAYPTYKGFAVYEVPAMKVGTRQAGKSNYLRFNIISDSIPNAWNGVNNNAQYVCGVSWLLDGYDTATTAEREALWRAYLADNPLEITYPLAEPVIISLTEQEVIETLHGNNNVWHDANGDTSVQYRADTKTYVDGLVKEENVSIIAPIETGTTASQAYAAGKYFLLNNQFCKAKTSIASGATFTLNTNYEVTTIADELYSALHS